jgi:DNA (cytosine-5)-methyltransferase 1
LYQRHLFLTDEQERVRIEDLLRVCFVFPRVSIPNGDLDLWVSLSPDHFYAQYHFPSTNVKSWDDRRLVHYDIDVCVECCRKEASHLRSMKDFIRFGQRAPLRALDLFGGVGTLGQGMAECQFAKVTHAVEISPSACKTFQCAILLR